MNFTRTRVAKSRRAPAAFTLAAIGLATLVAASSAAAAEHRDSPSTGSPFSASFAAPSDEAQDAVAPPTVDGRLSDRHSLGGDGIHVRGVVTSTTAKSLVTLQVRPAGRGSWHDAGKIRVAPGRKFTLAWRGHRPGRYAIRLVATAGGKRGLDHLGLAYVYRRTFASWYGPGFYGHRTACGGTLTASVVGVANKTLPCGTRVTFHLHGRTVTARVIDRGPYVGGREWDLTPALRRRLHFGSTGVVNTTR
ncbi:MAG: hypothetical protein HY827_10640 [Actinobacteria bacterium]|nr:hypothetical protein [Actinomycetota bacterium]